MNDIPFIYRKIFNLIRLKMNDKINIKELRVLLSKPLGITKKDCDIIIREMIQYDLLSILQIKPTRVVEINKNMMLYLDIPFSFNYSKLFTNFKLKEKEEII